MKIWMRTTTEKFLFSFNYFNNLTCLSVGLNLIYICMIEGRHFGIFFISTYCMYCTLYSFFSFLFKRQDKAFRLSVLLHLLILCRML